MMETFSIKMVGCLLKLCFNFQISDEEYLKIENINPTIQNAIVDEGPSTSNGGSRQSAPVEDVRWRQMYMFLCYECDESFTSNRDRSSHIESDHSRKSYHCHKCPRRFYMVDHLYEHILVDHRRYQFFCEDCKLIYFMRAGLTRHMNKNHLEIDLPCGICPRRFSNQLNLIVHMMINHRIFQSNCDVCRIIVPHEKLYDHHLKSHNVRIS